MGAEFDSLRQEFSLADRCFKVFNLWMLQKQLLETAHFNVPLGMTLGSSFLPSLFLVAVFDENHLNQQSCAEPAANLKD